MQNYLCHIVSLSLLTTKWNSWKTNPDNASLPDSHSRLYLKRRRLYRVVSINAKCLTQSKPPIASVSDHQTMFNAGKKTFNIEMQWMQPQDSSTVQVWTPLWTTRGVIVLKQKTAEQGVTLKNSKFLMTFVNKRHSAYLYKILKRLNLKKLIFDCW